MHAFWGLFCCQSQAQFGLEIGPVLEGFRNAGHHRFGFEGAGMAGGIFDSPLVVCGVLESFCMVWVARSRCCFTLCSLSRHKLHME